MQEVDLPLFMSLGLKETGGYDRQQTRVSTDTLMTRRANILGWRV